MKEGQAQYVHVENVQNLGLQALSLPLSEDELSTVDVDCLDGRKAVEWMMDRNTVRKENRCEEHERRLLRYLSERVGRRCLLEGRYKGVYERT